MSTTTDGDAMALAATVTPEGLDPRSDAPTLAAADPSDAPALDAGEPDGPRYITRRELGRGGMGEVRLDLGRRIGREAAVKRMRAEIADRGESRLRFLREARVQARLEHPSIVPVYDIEPNPADLSFYVPIVARFLLLLVPSLFPSRAPRWLVVAVGITPVLVAAAGEALGLWSATTAIVDGRIVVTPALLSLDHAPVLGILIALSAFPPAIRVFAIGRISDRSAAAEEAVHLQRWQLRQLLPEASA